MGGNIFEKNTKRIRLAICVYERCYIDNGNLFVENSRFLPMLLPLARQLQSILLFVPVMRTRPPSMTVKLELSNNVALAPIPWVRRSFYYWLPWNIWLWVIIVRRFWKLKSQWDVAFIVWPHLPSVLFLVLCVVLRRPNILYIRSHIKSEFLPYRKKSAILSVMGQCVIFLLEVLLRLLPRKSTFIVFAGEGVAISYKNLLDTKRYVTLHPSVIEDGDIVEEVKVHCREQFVVLYVGRIVPEKGLDILLDAISKMKDRSSVRLWVCGDGSELHALMKKAQNVGISENVMFWGFIRDWERLRDLYDESDVVVMPSITEGFGKVAVEAMARGKPVIASDLPGVPVKDNVSGIMFRVGDSDELCMCLERLRNDPKLREKLGNGGVQIARQFTKHRFYAEILSVLEKVSNT